MTGALIILAVTAATGLLLYLLQRLMPRRPDATGDTTTPTTPPAEADDPDSEVCCGQHITCEKDSLLAAMSKDIEYFEDEELDEYRGLAADDYSDAQIEQFRDVLYTLRPEEIAPWARSIQLRGITLPTPVKEELIMLAAEARHSNS